jgi:haloacetate dehalogenase
MIDANVPARRGSLADPSPFEGFTERVVQGEAGAIHAWVAGHGPGILLLHGYPQTHLMWRKIAPLLTDRYTVVASDLRGYGASAKPPGGERHEAYSKREMAKDQVQLMRALGHESFALIGHDRGARVAFRLALDHPKTVEKLVLLDIAPTDFMYRATNKDFATAYYHWFFLIQPFDLPERLIGADPRYYLEHTLESWSKTPGAFDQATLSAYVKTFSDPAAIHAACEDYRAAAGIDLEHDAADATTRLTQPLLALWGDKGVVGRMFDVEAAWRARATSLRAASLSCGHFVAEEVPEQLLLELRAFL